MLFDKTLCFYQFFFKFFLFFIFYDYLLCQKMTCLTLSNRFRDVNKISTKKHNISNVFYM